MNDEELRHLRDYYFEPVNQWARERVARVLEHARVAGGERLLDLGCANATFSFHTSKAGARPVGIDRNPVVLYSGREASRIIGGFVTPRVQADARWLPFRDDVFDIVINADFIEHTEEPTKRSLFAEMYRVMKPGGRGVVYSPNLNRVRWELRGEKLKRLIGKRTDPVPHWRDFVDPDHFGLTTTSHADALLRDAGFLTTVHHYEFHVPFFSRLPGFDRLATPALAGQFANRFLIVVEKKSS